jgi:hypothetical protein
VGYGACLTDTGFKSLKSGGQLRVPAFEQCWASVFLEAERDKLCLSFGGKYSSLRVINIFKSSPVPGWAITGSCKPC